MSTKFEEYEAKYMFEELGYVRQDIQILGHKVIRYIKVEDDSRFVIQFEYQGHFIRCYYDDKEFEEKRTFGLEIKELQAINKQVEELEWNKND